MNLFRSEEHVRAWKLFNPDSADGFISLADLAALFGLPSRRHLLDDNYLSFWYPQRAVERRSFLEGIGKTSSFWLPRPS